MTAEGGALSAAVGIFESTDGGTTWTTRYDDSAPHWARRVGDLGLPSVVPARSPARKLRAGASYG